MLAEEGTAEAIQRIEELAKKLGINLKPIDPNFDMPEVRKYLNDVVAGKVPGEGDTIADQSVIEDMVRDGKAAVKQMKKAERKSKKPRR